MTTMKSEVDVRADAALRTARQALAVPFPRYERAAVLERAAAAVAEDAETFAQSICFEVGKPIAAARGEVERAIATLLESAAVARSLGGGDVQVDAVPAGAGKLGIVRRVPVGVVVAITPFNFPLNLVCHKVGPGLAAGNAVILKPAEQAPETAALLLAALVRAGLPAGRLQVAQGDGATGAALVRREDVDAITFTGSSTVGWEIRAANPRARVLLELGSTAPLIVCEDGDARLAARAAARHGFSYSGQSCISVQRLILHEGVADAVLAELVDGVRELRVGEPEDESTAVGPLIDVAAADRVMRWIDEAARGGGRILVGGERLDRRTVSPTVVVDCPTDSELWRNEAFGPVVAVRTVAGLDEAIALANDSRFGLQAGVYTASLAAGLRCAEELEFGTVLVNEAPTFRVDHQPYGGGKESGTGKEGPAWAARELSDERLVVLQGTPSES